MSEHLPASPKHKLPRTESTSPTSPQPLVFHYLPIATGTRPVNVFPNNLLWGRVRQSLKLQLFVRRVRYTVYGLESVWMVGYTPLITGSSN